VNHQLIREEAYTIDYQERVYQRGNSSHAYKDNSAIIIGFQNHLLGGLYYPLL